MLDNETDVLPVGNPVPDDPMHDRINSGQTFTPHTTHPPTPAPTLPPGSRSVTSLIFRVLGDWHLKRYDLHNSETYGWKPSYPTSYESHACPLSSGIW